MSSHPTGRRHRLSDLYHERTHYQFIERSWRWAILSGTVLLVCILGLAIRGLNLGIDFTGGASWQFTVRGHSASVSAVRSRLQPLNLGNAKVLVLGSNGVRVQTKSLSAAKTKQVTDTLAKYGNVSASNVSLSSVSATWGKQVTDKAVKALVVFFALIAIYLSIRFEWRMAIAAILAVIHDIIVTVGVYALTQFEVTPATVVAFLTILGFSLYDTVVVFDKVKENTPTLGTVRGDTYSMMVNRSMNQVLMRSINTSFVALLPVASLLIVGSYIFGAVALEDFALALFVGLLTGAYSSIFVATPILAWWKEREPRYRALRERSAVQLARAGAIAVEEAPVAEPETVAPEAELEAEPAAAAAPRGRESGPAARPTRPTPTGTPRPPRPRQQRRRKRR